MMLFSKSNMFLSQHQWNFLLQLIGTNAETHSQAVFRELETLKPLAPKGLPPSDPYTQDSGNSVQEEINGKSVSIRGDGEYQGMKAF